MKIKPIKIMIISSLMMFLQGCKAGEENEFFSKIVNLPFTDFIEVSVWDAPTISHDDINLYIQNKTNDCIVFPNDFGIKIFYNQEGSWKSLPNLVRTQNTEIITLTSIDDFESDAVVFIRPDYRELTKRPKTLRIVFEANLCEDGIPTKGLFVDYFDILIQ
jgi:hypothetical protein